MESVYSLFRNVKYMYNAINPATLSGAIDVIVVEQPDGEYKSTPFHVRFGKYGVFSHNDKYVDITMNGEEIDLKMKLAESGIAFFVEESTETGHVPDYMITSPLPEPGLKHPQTDRVLAESAKKLEEQIRTQADVRSRAEARRRNSQQSSRESSRSLSPAPAPQRNQEQSLSELKRKRTQPFSSSVFSNRKNRSLPDLTTLSSLRNGNKSDSEEVHDQPALRKYSCRLPQSKSQALGKDTRESSVSSEDLLNDLRKTKFQKRKKSRVSFASKPIPINGGLTSDSEASSLSSSTASSPSVSMLNSADIADGALSDSEVDRQRNDAHVRGNDVTDWKWGQLPETRDELQKKKESIVEQPKKEESTASSWNWMRWIRSAPAPAKPEEQGITLDELMNNAKSDPVTIEKYLGKQSTGSLSVDSGHASRGVSQPASPASIDVITDKTQNSIERSNSTSTIASGSPLPSPTLVTAREPSREDVRSTSMDDIFRMSDEEVDVNIPTYVRSLRLSSEKLKSLNLEYGANECRFSITTKFQGTSWCTCNIYLYKWYEKIVISDIDGTITKSDVLGHVIPAIGGQWAHAGVAELYTRIKNNGYKMVYLSSRAIGQSHTTKQYLRSIAQDSKQLPDGPVLLSPTSVLMAFRREVIERRPEEFKIAALSDVKKLFPVKQPYYAGFGNRETDVTSYRAVDIPHARIYIIDPSGRVRRSDSVGLVSNYLSIANETVDYLFPPVPSINCLQATPKVQINSVSGVAERNTWTDPLEHSTFSHWQSNNNNSNALSDEELAKYETKRKESSKRSGSYFSKK